MKIRNAMIAFAMLLAVPFSTMAQTETVTFYVGVDYWGLGYENYISVDATLSCNAGIPLEQSATVGAFYDDDGVFFTVTEMPIDSTCTVTFDGTPDGWELDGAYGYSSFDGLYDNWEDACYFGPGDDELDVGSENTCMFYFEPAPVDFEVTVDWQISPDADVGVGMYAYVELECYGLMGKPGYSMTMLDADPEADMPLVLTGLYPNPGGDSYCYAYLYGTGSAVEVDESDCYDIDLAFGEGTSCTITATAFYEGVPTLSQYGMAIMVLLMLGMGFVGFRRFA